MIAVPIMGVSAADITIRSSQLTRQQTITREIGAADARLDDAGLGHQAVFQTTSGDSTLPARQAVDSGGPAAPGIAHGAGDAAVDRVDPMTGAPRGSRAITDANTYAGVLTKSGMKYTEVREMNAADPIAAGIMDLTRGRFATVPDEMIATNAFLEHSGLHVGSDVRAFGLDRTYRIVGAYDLPSMLNADQLDALPGAFIDAYHAAREAAGSDLGTPRTPSYLVVVPGDFTWDMVRRANTLGVTVRSRAVTLDPPADSEVPFNRLAGHGERPADDHRAELTAAATIAGLALLEVCLLAGPAFAVGARRSRRHLGLVGANGGDRRHIRAIVLSGGLVIGCAAAVVGILAGAVLPLLLRTTLEDYVGSRFGGIVLRPAELLGIAGLAVLTGLLAAIVPAVTASRQSVLSSLTGRKGVRRAGRALPVVGCAAVCLGAAIALYGSLHSDNSYVVAGGSAIAELGLVALTPLLVGGFGRLSRWLPLAPRLALRDAVRNRSRTAPAVAAVLAAVAGTVAVATYTASQDQQNRDQYSARAPSGVLAVSLRSGQGLEAVRQSVDKRFPVVERADVLRLAAGTRICDQYSSQPGCGGVEPVTPQANECPSDPDKTFSTTQLRSFATDWRCQGMDALPPIDAEGGLLVGGPRVLRVLGIEDPAAQRALAQGRTVLFNRAYADHGSLKLRVIPDRSKTESTITTLPVLLSSAPSYGISAVVPESAARAAGLKSVPLGDLFATSRMPTESEQQQLTEDIAKLGTDADVYLERGYPAENSLILVALAIFAGLVTIGAAGIATGLAQADAEADLRTLASVGAPPRVRRTLSGFQCGVVSAMGVLLGTAAGILPAVALRRTERRHALDLARQGLDQGHVLLHNSVPLVVPWTTIGLLLVLVPLGATLLAALVTRSRSHMGRRAQE
ncbi:FtsX-like permease family protein [Streptomyces sp. NPDC002306]